MTYHHDFQNSTCNPNRSNLKIIFTETYIFYKVHFIGEVKGCSGFADKRLFLNFKVASSSEKWRLIQGEESGQTWISKNETV